ncbi:MAG: hypothetical protein K2Z81_19130 [Cyanobacteria bacterium]|nr:hypothetical protein [Cyanobacteriota bacterium]
MDPLHSTGGIGLAGACFAIGYIVGIFAGRKLGLATLWPSIIIGVICCLVRGFSAPLEFAAIASVSVLHVAIGCLTILILKHTKPLAAKQPQSNS